VEAYGTLVDAGGRLTHLFPRPETLAEADLAPIGLPRARADSISAMARAVSERRLSFAGAVDVNSFLTQFRSLPGIGDWTAQYVAMRAFGDPDAFPSSDLGLLHASTIRNPKELEKRSWNWRPWRAYAAMCLWSRAA